MGRWAWVCPVLAPSWPCSRQPLRQAGEALPALWGTGLLAALLPSPVADPRRPEVRAGPRPAVTAGRPRREVARRLRGSRGIAV